MSLEKWELSYNPTEKDKDRWRLKLRIDEKELPELLGGIPVPVGRPFLLENDVFSFALYIYDGSDENLQKLKLYLGKLCPAGRVVGPGNEESLNTMLDRVMKGMDDVPAGGKAEPAPQAKESMPIPPVSPVAPAPAASSAPVSPEKKAGAGIDDLPINPHYTFQEFIIGPNNRFTAAAAQAVADNPGKIYNPFFIYGGVGLGKTHLMHAVGHYVKGKNPAVHLLYVTTEKFMSEVIDAIRQGTQQSLREHYRQVDLLLVDDIQFLVESESTQEEFFHIFNVLHQNGKQIIITSDRPPKQLTTLEDRLRSRFEWGLIADIKSPNLETRVAILKKKEELENLRLDENILLYIASKLKSNIRELEGFLKRINAYASLTHQEVNMDLVKELMSDLLPEEQDEAAVTPQETAGAPRNGDIPKPPVAPAPRMQDPVMPTLPPEVAMPWVAPSEAAPVPPVEIPLPKFVPAAPAASVPEPGDSNMKPVEVGFFFPEGKSEELNKVKERFREVIRKHKLKFRLEGIFERTYSFAGKIDYASFAELCKTNNVRIAVVLGPPSDTAPITEDFGDLLTTVMDDAKLSLQLVPWPELGKDYRYLNLALDITLLKHHS